METLPRKSYRLIVDFKSQFPEKLYDVVNDGYLIHWNRNGSISVNSEEEFENSVMRLYPGFLQIPTFLNFKRLFREYGFDRVVNENNEYEFSHPFFIRGRRDLTKKILTRRKSLRFPANFNREEPLIINAEEGKRYSTRKRKRTTLFNPNTDSCQSTDETETESQGDTYKTYIISHTDMKRYPVVKPEENNNQVNPKLQNDAKYSNTKESPKLQKIQIQNIMEKYAEKEFTEQEYEEWMAKQRKLDKLNENSMREKKQESNVHKTREFWWMYDDKFDASSEVKDKPTAPENCMPCGFCKCCSAISNYVHIFGEIPENIQVFDYLVEVPVETEVNDENDMNVASEVIIETQ